MATVAQSVLDGYTYKENFKLNNVAIPDQFLGVFSHIRTILVNPYMTQPCHHYVSAYAILNNKGVCPDCSGHVFGFVKATDLNDRIIQFFEEKALIRSYERLVEMHQAKPDV
jgi:hypothetical protein